MLTGGSASNVPGVFTISSLVHNPGKHSQTLGKHRLQPVRVPVWTLEPAGVRGTVYHALHPCVVVVVVVVLCSDWSCRVFRSWERWYSPCSGNDKITSDQIDLVKMNMQLLSHSPITLA